MDFLRNMIASTQENLAALGTSQKLVIGLCVVIMSGAIVWMFQWSGESEWVPVLPGQLWTEEELEAVKEILEEGQYRVSGKQLLVPASDRRAIRSKLGQAGALPSDTRMGFEQLMKETSPWKSQTQQSREWIVAYGNQLAIDLESWSGVRNARVILQMPKRRGIGGRVVRPSASVSIGLDASTSMSRSFTRAIAGLVAGATGMRPENVEIVDTKTHKSHRVPDDASGLGDDLLEKRRDKEKYFQEKIQDHLDIPGVRVTTFVEIETDRRSESARTPTEGKSIEKSEMKEETSEKREPSATDPGVQPNTSKAQTASGRVEETENSSRTMEYESELGFKTTTTEFTIGGLKNVSASINVPRSYLAGIFSRQSGNKDKAPTDKDIDTVADIVLVKVSKQVVNAIGATDPNLVVVDWFDDQGTGLAAAGWMPGMPRMPGMPGMPAEGESVVAMLKANSRQAGLGFLAVLSLGMMLMIVRKGPATAARERDKHPGLGEGAEDLELLGSGIETIGEVASAEAVLQGHEVSEGAIQLERQIGQVGSLVQDDPEMAANLIARWVRR